MPLYEYQCKKCKHRFEKIQKFSDRAIKKCPECGGPVEKLTSLSAVQFKGSGWYKTDYATKSSVASSGESANSDSSADTSSAELKTDGKKSESKPEKSESGSDPSSHAPAKETKKPAKKK